MVIRLESLGLRDPQGQALAHESFISPSKTKVAYGIPSSMIGRVRAQYRKIEFKKKNDVRVSYEFLYQYYFKFMNPFYIYLKKFQWKNNSYFL